MKNKKTPLLATALFLPVLAIAQLSPADGLTTIINHEFSRTGEDLADELVAAGQPDTGDGVTVWDDDVDKVTELENAGYTVYNGNDNATWAHYIATQVDGEPGYLRLRPVDEANAAVEELDIGIGVQFAPSDKGYVSLEMNFIGGGNAYFYMQLLNGTDVLASLEIRQPDPFEVDGVNWTTGAGTTGLAEPGVTDFVSTNGAPDLLAVTPVQIAWESGLVDIYFGDMKAGATTLLDESLIGGATEVTEFRIIANAPAGSGNKNRMRLEELSVQVVADAPTWAGYAVDANGYVNTDSFMGWVYPMDDYVWVQSLSSWMYLPEDHVSTLGGWAYVPN